MEATLVRSTADAALLWLGALLTSSRPQSPGSGAQGALAPCTEFLAHEGHRTDILLVKVKGLTACYSSGQSLLAGLLFLPVPWTLGLFLATQNQDDAEIWWESIEFAKHCC